MVGVQAFYQSSIGKKVLMAVTGLVWIGFVIFHMYGNLKVFGGAVHFNEYSEGLREIGTPIFNRRDLLWVARLGLVVSFVVHVWAALQLTRQNLQSRSTRYTQFNKVQANYASRSMVIGGVILLLFVIFHLLHLTFGVPGIHNNFIPGEVYHNVITGLRPIPVAIFYIVAMIALGFHLFHGIWSLFQTLGINNKRSDRPLRALALIVAIVTPLGFIAIPVAVLAGIVQL